MTKLHLFEVPKNSYVQGDYPPGFVLPCPPMGILSIPGEILHFHHVDGMYSYCERKDGTVVHIPAVTYVVMKSKEDFENQNVDPDEEVLCLSKFM
jgi:hypothetical protein